MLNFNLLPVAQAIDTLFILNPITKIHLLNANLKNLKPCYLLPFLPSVPLRLKAARGLGALPVTLA
ncbi:MAG: hypothetical protein AAFQ80_13070 [Cyanobacteria bacterium J06621_8]